MDDKSCCFYEPWHLKSELIKSGECFLWTGEECYRKEPCPMPWLKNLTARVAALDSGEGED